jgi:DNA-binding transcriptional ArsR family regulator
VSDYEMADSLLVDRDDQHRAMGNLTRHRILGLLLDRAMTVTQLAEALGVLKGSASFHVRTLERAGLVREVRTRKVRGVTERYYGRVARAYELDSPDAPDVDAGGLLLRTVAAQRERVRDSAATDTVSTVRARLDPARAAEFRTRVEALLVDFRAASADGPAYSLTVAYFRTEPEA